MTSSAPLLASLDCIAPATLAPAIWEANLAALAEEDRAFADALRAAVLPQDWRPATGLDGSPTWRLEPNGAPPIWLGGTAAPARRAAGLLSRFDPGGRNAALACCGAGAEAVWLLAHTPAHTAVFVFETDIRVIAAVLRTHDFAPALRAGRCLLVPPGRERTFLTAMLERYPGLLPPGDIVLPDLVSAERVRELRDLCGGVMQQFVSAPPLRPETRAPEMVEASDETVARMAIIALSAHAPYRALAARLARAAAGLGWPTCVRTLAGPRDAHPRVHCAALASFAPTVTIWINHATNPIPSSLPNTCAWILEEPAAATPLQPGVLYLAASPTIAAALRKRPEKIEVVDWYWACDGNLAPDGTSGPTETAVPSLAPPAPTASAGAPLGRFVLVGSRPDSRPESYGVKHSTHRILWEQLRRSLARDWDTPLVLAPEKLLVRAERACGLEVGDAELRAGFVRLIDQVLVPLAVVEAAARVLGADGPVCVIGPGWQGNEADLVRWCADEVADVDFNATAPELAVFVQPRDPLSPALLDAAVRGWPLLVYDRGGRTLAASLGGVLQAGRHYEPFADTTALRNAIKSVLKAPEATRRRAVRARGHIVDQHTTAQRLRELAAHLSSRRATG